MKKLIIHRDHQALIDAAISDGSIMGLAAVLVAFTGARSNEILTLDQHSIDIVECASKVESIAIRIKSSKGGVDRSIFLPIELYAPVKVFRDSLKEGGLKFFELIGEGRLSLASCYNEFRIYFNSLQLRLFGEQRHTLHAFRHTLAIKAMKAGHNIIEVKRMLGHRSINTTMHYLAEYEASITLNNIHTLVRSSS